MKVLHIVHFNGYSLVENDKLVAIPRKKGKATALYNDWAYVCWGDRQKQLMGRIPMAIWSARVLRAQHLIWSTGCTRLPDGLWEAEVCYELALTSYKRLKRDFPKRFGRAELWSSERSYREWLKRLSRFEIVSRNTMTSMEEAALLVKKLAGRNQAFVHSVSSTNHVSRVLRDAIVAFNLDGGGRVTLSAVAAETGYGGHDANRTVVRDLGT